MNADLVRVRNAIAALVAIVFEVDACLARMITEQVGVGILVARSSQLFQLQFLEVVREVVEEMADLWIVTIAENGLALEMLRVMPQLLLDIRKLGVILVLLGGPRAAQASIQRFVRYVSLRGIAILTP